MKEELFYIFLAIICFLSLFTLKQCVVETERINAEEDIAIMQLESRPAFYHYEWYEGCLAGCKLAGNRAIGDDAIGIGNLMIPKCSEYCMEQLKQLGVD